MTVTIVGTVYETPDIRENSDGHAVYALVSVGAGLLWSLKCSTSTRAAADILARKLKPGSRVAVEAAGAVPLVADGHRVLRMDGITYVGSPSHSYL